jgi:hypothetical protein
VDYKPIAQIARKGSRERSAHGATALSDIILRRSNPEEHTLVPEIKEEIDCSTICLANDGDLRSIWYCEARPLDRSVVLYRECQHTFQ